MPSTCEAIDWRGGGSINWSALIDSLPIDNGRSPPLWSVFVYIRFHILIYVYINSRFFEFQSCDFFALLDSLILLSPKGKSVHRFEFQSNLPPSDLSYHLTKVSNIFEVSAQWFRHYRCHCIFPTMFFRLSRVISSCLFLISVTFFPREFS